MFQGVARMTTHVYILHIQTGLDLSPVCLEFSTPILRKDAAATLSACGSILAPEETPIAEISASSPTHSARQWLAKFSLPSISAIHEPRKPASRKRSDSGNRYWCTVCADPHSYQKSDDWKKHMKEHETTFICGLTEETEVREGIEVCVYCGVESLGKAHFEIHKTHTCRTAKAGPPSSGQS